MGHLKRAHFEVFAEDPHYAFAVIFQCIEHNGRPVECELSGCMQILVSRMFQHLQPDSAVSRVMIRDCLSTQVLTILLLKQTNCLLLQMRINPRKTLLDVVYCMGPSAKMLMAPFGRLDDLGPGYKNSTIIKATHTP